MKGFGTWVRGELERQKCSSKDVIGRIFDGLVPDSDSIATVTTKFSKLLNGDPEGDRYFMEPGRPDRLSALAKAINRSVDEVVAARARCNSVRTLILDPRLHADHVASLGEISSRSDAGFSCVVVPDSGDVRRALRDAADRAENAIVVVADAADIEVFELAKIESTVLEVVPRGYRLKSYPDVIQVPSPRPPRTFGENGEVLIPIPGPIELRSHYHDNHDFYRRLVQPAVERDETPCLSLCDAIEWFTRPGGPVHSNNQRRVQWVDVPRLTAKHLIGDNSCETQVWEDAGSVFAVGPRTEEVAALLRPHHEIRVAPLLRAWNEATKNANPWRLAESAEAPDHALHAVRGAVAEWARSAVPAMLEELAGGRPSQGSLVFGPAPIEGRQILREISRRAFDRTAASSAFVLSRAVEAPWVVFDADDGNIDVVADMGAGTLLSIRGRRVDGTPNGVRLLQREAEYGDRRYSYQALECGDFVLALRADSDVRLEGPLLPARARRRAASDEQGSYDDD